MPRANARSPGDAVSTMIETESLRSSGMQIHTKVKVSDAMRALAFIGDLSMGQPTDHSMRTAWLSAKIAAVSGHDLIAPVAAQEVALLRWSGCTANAPEFADLLGDDVAGRADMLAHKFDNTLKHDARFALRDALKPISQIHCEVSGDIAQMLGFGPNVERSLRCIFETADGMGIPNQLPGVDVPPTVFAVALASDLEILGRLHGANQALAVISQKAGATYPQALVDTVMPHVAGWLTEISAGNLVFSDLAEDGLMSDAWVHLEIVADVVDLKLPWMTGYSRRTAEVAHEAAVTMGLAERSQELCYRAGLIHGIGRAAIPNAVWNASGGAETAGWEQIRLAPYWTSRAARHIGNLAEEAEIASYEGERLDGSGHFRGCVGSSIPLEAQVVAAASMWVLLRTPRPWAEALSEGDAREELLKEARLGRLNPDAANAMTGYREPLKKPSLQVGDTLRDPSLTARETDVLRGISHGLTNKEVARLLSISPRTVGTHVENAFRKLGCTTRAAATLKAATLKLF